MSEYSYRKRSRERELRKRRRILICAGTLIAVSLVVGLAALIKVIFFGVAGSSSAETTDSIQTEAEPVAESEQGVISKGVYIAGTDVGGMDYAEVNKALDDYVKTLVTASVDINVNDNTVTASLQDIGVECDTDSAVAGAFELENPGTVNLQFDVDEDIFSEYLNKQCRQYEVKPKNAKLKRTNGAFVVKKGKVGKTIDEKATREALISTINDSLVAGKTMSVDAVIIEENPEYTSEDMARCKDVLGKFSTNFQESQRERSANLRNAVSFIDGSIVYPGETFSVAGTIYPLSEDNGYKAAPSYADGQVVDSLGGGVCQVSTTLYNAILRAELEVIQRQNHSMMVTYVDASMDAAIAGDYKDFKFCNNSDTPVYIQGNAYGGVLTFTVYGHETRPADRKVEFKSEKVQTIEPGNDIVTKDPTKPEGYEHVTQSAHVGCIANLYKIVYENGVEVSNNKINSSRYNAEPRHVIVGAKKSDKDKDKDKDKDGEESEDKKDKKDKDKKDKDKKDKKTDEIKEKPAATEAPAPQEPVQTHEEPVQEETAGADGVAVDGGGAVDAPPVPAGE